MKWITQTRALSKSYGSLTALGGVDLNIGRGVTALLGPNGAGKTTLLRILATVLKADAGGIRVLGLDPSTGSNLRTIRERIGYMPQDPSFYPRFRVSQFIDYFAILKGLGDRPTRIAEVQRVVAAVGLQKVARKRLAALSGGMRRRVALAQALLGEPRLLILDEPIVGLDPEQRFRFREIISHEAQRAAVILSTHQTDDVAALAGRVIVLHEGVVRFDGEPAALAEMATGRVWTAKERSPHARIAWRTGSGEVRNLGDPPPGTIAAQPSIDDGYLSLVGVGDDTPSR